MPESSISDQLVYPANPQARASLRRERIANGRRKGEWQAREMFASIKCSDFPGTGGARHAGDPDGCRSGGSNCLCECHDLAQPTT